MSNSFPAWEYMRIVAEEATQADWKKWGYDGWELVTVSKGIAYFKRPLP